MKLLSWPLRAYVLLIVVAPVPILAAAWSTLAPLAAVEVATTTVLFALAWLAQRYPLHLGPKLKVTVEEGATFAAALTLAPFVAMLVAGASNALAVRFNAAMPLYNRLFNAAASLLSTAAAAFVYRGIAAGRPIEESPLAVVAAAVAGYLVRTEVVDFAIALQLRRPLLAAWWLDHRRDIAQLACLYAVGALAAMVAEGHPWGFLLFVAPAALIFSSFQETIRLRSQTREAILQLADLIDARDAYTFGHSQRVAQYAERLAQRFHMSEPQVELIREAARLHDIGKISTEDRILQKPGTLSPEEMAEMRKHCEHGYRFLKQLPEFWEGAELVRLHHERYDGAGYPRGLGGEALPQEASIIAVADAWDAMTSDRPYRAALRPGEARAELLRHGGTQWDPAVVAAFLELLDEERLGDTAPLEALRPVSF